MKIETWKIGQVFQTLVKTKFGGSKEIIIAT
jgi:hypothetical protein